MELKNYKKAIVVKASPAAAFAAVTQNVDHWWTRPDRPLQAVGDRAKFSFPPGASFWTFELTNADRPTRVEWTCVEALHLHEGQPKAIETEWLGTKVQWDIHPEAEGTRIEFEHSGLHPDLLCYEVCEAGWDFFFLDSLQQYLDTGTGKPHRG